MVLSEDIVKLNIFKEMGMNRVKSAEDYNLLVTELKRKKTILEEKENEFREITNRYDNLLKVTKTYENSVKGIQRDISYVFIPNTSDPDISGVNKRIEELNSNSIIIDVKIKLKDLKNLPLPSLEDSKAAF